MERFQRGLVAVILVVISLATGHCTTSASLPPTATSILAATAVPTLAPAPSTPTPSVLLRAVPQDLPKGQRVILYSTRGNELGLLDVEKGTRFPLVELEGNGSLDFVRASPTGDSIAFELAEPSPLPRQQEFSLWRLDLQSRQVELLWDRNTLMKRDFAWAPDDRTIVVSLLDYAKYKEMFQGVWLVDVTTKERKPLIQPMVKLSTDGFIWVYRWPVWSPQGDRIAIDGGYDGHESFGCAYVMDADDGSLRLLSERGRVDGWSPDGSEVLVDPGVFDDFTPWVEWILSVEGQELGCFVSAEDWDDVGGIWSPDGKRVYFYSQKAVQEGTMDPSLLWNVFIDQPLHLPLTDFFSRPPYGSPFYYIPTPSGIKLVFNRYEEGAAYAESIWAVDIASGTRMNLGDGFACDVLVVKDLLPNPSPTFAEQPNAISTGLYYARFAGLVGDPTEITMAKMSYVEYRELIGEEVLPYHREHNMEVWVLNMRGKVLLKMPGVPPGEEYDNIVIVLNAQTGELKEVSARNQALQLSGGEKVTLQDGARFPITPPVFSAPVPAGPTSTPVPLNE